MNVLEAKIKYSNEPVRQQKITEITEAFFDEFNPESTFRLKDNVCNLKIRFKDPPKNLISKIMEAFPDELSYVGEALSEDTPSKLSNESKVSNEAEEEESEPEVSNETEEEESEPEVSNEAEEEESEPEVSDEAEEEEPKSEVSNEIEEEESEPEVSDEAEKEESKPEVSDEAGETKQITQVLPKRTGRIIEDRHIPLLDEIAKKSSSYEEFVNSVSETIGFGKRKLLFSNFVEEAALLERVSLSEISKKLNHKGIKTNNSDINIFSTKVSSFFRSRREQVSFGVLINAMIKYKDYAFETRIIDDDESSTNTSIEQTTATVQTNETSASESAEPVNICNERIKLPSMPEIPKFEEFLANIDKTKSIEDRVSELVDFMNTIPDLSLTIKHHIVQYISTGIKMKNFDNDKIKEKFIVVSIGSVRMYTSMLINEFIKTNSKSADVIRPQVFIEELQKVLLTGDELNELL